MIQSMNVYAVQKYLISLTAYFQREYKKGSLNNLPYKLNLFSNKNKYCSKTKLTCMFFCETRLMIQF